MESKLCAGRLQVTLKDLIQSGLLTSALIPYQELLDCVSLSVGGTTLMYVKCYINQLPFVTFSYDYR